MNWLETLLGWSPDDGNGSLEVLIASVALALVAACLRAIARQRQPTRRRPGLSSA